MMKLTAISFLIGVLFVASSTANSFNTSTLKNPSLRLSNTSKARQPKPYNYRSYGDIVNTLLELGEKYPQYAQVFTAQEKYNLSTPKELMCKRNGKNEFCQQYVIHITDHSTLPDKDRPEIFFSGALHGDEAVGPNTVTELALYLLDHAGRPDGLPWIKHLIRTRSVFIMPTTNAYGYANQVRRERNIDPNRDFVYLSSPSCMESMTARAVNELWRDHIFQLSITFHGGTEVVAYEWGSYNHDGRANGKKQSDRTPDDLAQAILTQSMSEYGGAFAHGRHYPYGTSNDLIYPVNGGMEDWAYAGSWENNFSKEKVIIPCKPKQYGGYPEEKTIYDDATLRAFNILVETSNEKSPQVAALGNDATLADDKVMDFTQPGTTLGHIPRNIRLCLLMIDIVQPYIEWKEAGSNNVFNWEVLGSFTVDDTHLEWSTDSTFSSGVTRTPVQKGKTRWSQAGNHGTFTANVTFPKSGKYFVRAVARVDQNWATQETGVNAPVPHIPPQSHVVNARTNAEWNKESSGHRVKGQLDWYSTVKQVQV